MVVSQGAGNVPAEINAALTELVRQGARQIITQAIEAELKEFLAQYQCLKNDQGRQAIVRNGYLPERTITIGVGEVWFDSLPSEFAVKMRRQTDEPGKFAVSVP